MSAVSPLRHPAPRGARWFAVQTQASKEHRVRQLLELLIEDERLEAGEEGRDPEIFNVLVPTHQTAEIRNGKRVEVTKRLYPGYVLVQMIMREHTLHAVSAVAGVLRFVGPQPMNPKPLHEAEINRILGIRDEAEDERDRVPFWPDQSVEITEGPFKEFNGVVREVDHDKGRVRVEVSLFGRPTSVDLDYTQLKRS